MPALYAAPMRGAATPSTSRRAGARRCTRVHAVDFPKKTVIDYTAKKKKDPVADFVGSKLMNASVILVGSNDQLLETTCKTLAERLIYFPTYTKNTLLGVRKAESVEQVVEQEGWDALRRDEAELLKGIADQLKCVTSTLANGASVEARSYPGMLSSFIVHIDDATADSTPEQDAQRQFLSTHAEVSVTLQPPVAKGFQAAPVLSAAKKARECSNLVLKELQTVLQQHPELPELKNQYGVERCRGQPPSLLQPLPADVQEVVDASLEQSS